MLGLRRHRTLDVRRGTNANGERSVRVDGVSWIAERKPSVTLLSQLAPADYSPMATTSQQQGDGVIRRRAARLLLCSIAMPVVFGCSAATTTSTAPNHAAIGVPVEHAATPVDQVLAAARIAAPATTAPSTTSLVIPAPEPVPAAPENADANEMQPAPTTTAAPAVAIVPRRTAAAPAASTAAPAPAEPLAPAATTGRLDLAAAADFAARTNSLRASLGLGALSRNGQLDALAAGWARELATSGRLRHSTIPDRVVASGWGTAGENVGVGGSVASVHNALVNSPGHYANLAGETYTAFGIAVVIGDDGRLWVCEVFAG
jgi:uncharacterized protein YkwD